MNRRRLLGLFVASALVTGTTLSQAQAQDKLYIPLISKGFQHQFWQAVKAGADQAAEEFGVEVTFEGPDSEAQVDRQIDMLAAALAKSPDAIGFAALDSQAAIPLLRKANDAGIPIVAFDSGVARDIPVTMLVREEEYWDNVLPKEEASMISDHIREHHIDLRLQHNLKEILDRNHKRRSGFETKRRIRTKIFEGYGFVQCY